MNSMEEIMRISDAENYSLSTIGADEALKEFFGPRADSEDAKIEMYRNIASQGYTYLKDLPNDTSKKQTLNTVNQYLIGAGIASDLFAEDNIGIKSNNPKLKNLL